MTAPSVGDVIGGENPYEPSTRASGYCLRDRRARLGFDRALAALTVLALLAGAYHLGAKSFWLDEAVSAEHARLGLAGLVKVIGGEDPNQGLDDVLLSGWARIFGYGEISLRSLTVVLGALSVPGLAVLGTRLFGRSVGLLSGLLLALSPFFVHYEQTARAYALLVVLVTWSSYFFVCELESPARATRVGYVIASTLAFYAHYFAVYVLLVQLLTLIVVKKRAALTREWLIAGGAIAALCTPEVLAARSKGTLAIHWIPQPSIGSVIHVGSSLGGGACSPVRSWSSLPTDCSERSESHDSGEQVS